jgi:hypothetical protein
MTVAIPTTRRPCSHGHPGDGARRSPVIAAADVDVLATVRVAGAGAGIDTHTRAPAPGAPLAERRADLLGEGGL